MKNNKNNLEKEEIIKRILLVSIFSVSMVGVSLINHFFFMSRPDKIDTNNGGLILLIVLCSFALLFLTGYLLNIFIFKHKRTHTIMSSIADGGTIFCLSSSIIILISSHNDLSFNKDYVSIFINSSFSLLGFGLAVVAILTPRLVAKISEMEHEKQIKFLFEHFLSYSLIFIFGLIYTVSSLLEIQNIDVGYYKIIIFKSLFYSVFQIFFIIYQIFQYVWFNVSSKEDK